MQLKETHRLLKAIDFAAYKHRFQKRKDEAETPYINHPVKVALSLTDIGKEDDIALLEAAILHDTIEDTETMAEEIESLFGKEVLDIVLEVTDDKDLPKEVRKQKQIEHATHLSLKAKKVKLADKICNVTDVVTNPPFNWSIQRKLEYLQWAEDVAKGLQGANTHLENHLAMMIEKGRQIFLSLA